jgi:L-asparaginase
MIHLIYTGGTIGMVRRSDGALEPASIEDLLKYVPELDLLGEWDYATLDPPRDSVDLGPQDWIDLARHIGKHYDNYEGFVILHGTDTMVYTAAALSFLLEGLHKPVILTGAQLPIGAVRNDARNNLITAIELASSPHPHVSEVGIYFNGLLLRGNRAVKTSIFAFDAFTSPNFPPLARVGVYIHYPAIPPRPPAPAQLSVYQKLSSDVALVKLFPGITPRLLEALIDAPIRGLVLETFGSGNIPGTPGLIEVIERAVAQRGLLTVAITQQRQGIVQLHTYAAGRRLLDAGVVSGNDMTPCTALVKLMFLLAQESLTPEERRSLMASNLRGELSFPDGVNP